MGCCGGDCGRYVVLGIGQNFTFNQQFWGLSSNFWGRYGVGEGRDVDMWVVGESGGGVGYIRVRLGMEVDLILYEPHNPTPVILVQDL